MLADFHYYIGCGTLAVFRDGEQRPLAVGYSGARGHINHIPSVSIRSKGPVPPGTWYLARAPWSRRGPQVISLTPDVATQTYGRTAFLIHGDNKRQNQTASAGCIIMPRHVRDVIAARCPATLLVHAGHYVTDG